MKADNTYQFSFHKLSEKDIKSLKIVELISNKGIISRTEISKTTGVNIVSISNYIKRYIDNKLITEKGFDISTGGRKPELIELNKNDNYVIGCDIGKDFIRVVLTDIGLNIIGKAQAPKVSGTTKETTAAICGLIEEVIKKASLPSGSIKVIGIGAGAGDYTYIGKETQGRTGIATFVGDEPFCGAFGERSLNRKISPGDMLYVYSDIGSAVLVKEDDNVISRDDSKYLSPWKEGLGAVSLAKSDVARGVGTSIVEIAKGKMENITTETMTEAAINNDEVALSIMRSVGMSLGLRIAYLINLFDPKTVVIGGGVEKAGNLILDPIKKTVKKLSLKDRSGAIVIMPGMLAEEAVSMGAASLAVRELFLKI